MTRPTKYPVREKDDIIDWKGMPPGRCFMNFRPPEYATLDGNFRLPLLWRSLVAAAIAIGGTYSIGFLIASSESIEFIAWGAVAILAPLFLCITYVSGQRVVSVFNVVIQLIALKLFASFIFPEHESIIVGCWGLAILVPKVLSLSDHIATHAVHWFTAHPNLDLTTLFQMRAMWNTRRIGKRTAVPELDKDNLVNGEAVVLLATMTRYYRHFQFAVVLAVVSIVAILSAAGLRDLYSIALVVSATFVGSAVLIELKLKGTSGLVLKMLRHYVEYKGVRGNPRWIFLSPVGSVGRRRLKFQQVLILAMGYVACCWSAGGFDAGSWKLLGFTPLYLTCLINAGVLIGLAPLVLFCGTIVAAGPIIWYWHRACEGETAGLKRKNWDVFQSYVDRLRNSSNPNERNAVWVGFHLTMGFPILLDIKLVKEHMHILGATGSGKTALGLSTLIAQLVKRGDGPVIVLDCKGDRALLHSTMQWTEQEGRKFKWFTTTHSKSTYIFNPLEQKNLESATLAEIVGFFMLAFNLTHGEGYGRSWYTAVASGAFRAALKELDASPQTFNELQQVMEKLTVKGSDYHDAKQLMFVMRTLAEFEQLTISRESRNNPAAAHAIYFPEAIEKKQVIYFSLESLTDSSSAGEISRLVTYSATSAAREYQERTGKPANVYLVIDEAQEVIAKNISKILAQARSCGLTCILAHQSLSQLKTSDIDLAQEVAENTCVQLCFSARDPDTKKHLAGMSGEVMYYSPSWKQFAQTVGEGDVGMHRALEINGEPAIVDIAEQIGPRLTDDDLSEVNLNQNQCAISLKRYEGLSRLRGAFPIHLDFPISKEEFETRSSRTPWPSVPGETINTKAFWPLKNDETIFGGSDPDNGFGEEQITEEDIRKAFRNKQKGQNPEL